MTIEITNVEEDRVVLYLRGRMNAENAPDFSQVCQRCLDEGRNKIVVDLSELTYISSTGLRGLLGVGKKLQAAGGKLQVCCLTGLVKQVFEVTNLTAVFGPQDSVESALAAIA